jgi:integrase
MAHARSRKLKTGKFWYMVEDDDTEHACGKGRKGKTLANGWASRINDAKYLTAAGIEVPPLCAWTLSDLKAADMAEAARRGLRTVRPQITGTRGGKSRRESHWKALLAFFGEKTPIDEITQERIRAYIERRESRGRKVRAATINRDLWGVLRPALRLARETEVAFYDSDPFAKLRKLDERQGRREPIALSREDTEKFIRQCWTTDARLGAFVELLYLTASRLSQEPASDGRFLRYPAHKGGLPRTFALSGRLAKVARLPRTFDRKLWRAAAEAFKRPKIRPHDLRHSRLTHEGERPGVALLDVQRLGGWRSPAMASTYLHPGDRALQANLPGVRRERRAAKQVR